MRRICIRMVRFWRSICDVQIRFLWSTYCLWFAYYNFCRAHQTLRVTPYGSGYCNAD
jgi:hypothetical protein